MGVFKEEARIIEAVAKKQNRIYNDAADYGYAYDTKNPGGEITSLMSVIAQFKEADKKDSELPFIRNREEWGDDKSGGVSIDVVIFWEQDEGYYMGTKYTISFNRTPKHPSLINKECNAFIYVESSSYREKI